MCISLINEDVTHLAVQLSWVLLQCEPDLNSLNQASHQDLRLAGCKPRGSSCANCSDEQPGVVSQLRPGLPSSPPTCALAVRIEGTESAPVCWVALHLGARGHVHTDVRTRIEVTQSLSKGGKSRLGVLSSLMLAKTQHEHRFLHMISSWWTSLVLDTHKTEKVNLSHKDFSEDTLFFKIPSLVCMCTPDHKHCCVDPS